jgi:hypothetical protein
MPRWCWFSCSEHPSWIMVRGMKRSGAVSGARGREDLFELGNQKFVALVHKLRAQAPSNCRQTSVRNRPWRSACGAGDLRTVSSLLIFSGSEAHLQGSTARAAQGARQRFDAGRRGWVARNFRDRKGDRNNGAGTLTLRRRRTHRSVS